MVTFLTRQLHVILIDIDNDYVNMVNSENKLITAVYTPTILDLFEGNVVKIGEKSKEYEVIILSLGHWSKCRRYELHYEEMNNKRK